MDINNLGKRKDNWLRDAGTEVLNRILGSLSEQEAAAVPTPAMPLAGIVQIEGIGMIPTKRIRQEVARREQERPAMSEEGVR
jgi:hypothetical protein